MAKITDINVKIEGITFCCRACAVVENGNKILFQKRKDDTYWALPGGKIEVLETTASAIKRELQEELGINDLIVGNVTSVIENFFEFKGEKVHQYIFTHQVTINNCKYNDIVDEFVGAEVGKDVIFKWIDKSDLKKIPIKPDYVIDQILKMNDNINFTTCIED